MSSYLVLTVLQMMLAEAYNVSAREVFDGYDSEDLNAPTGRPDPEISVFMTGEGFQLEIRNTLTGDVSRVTETWEETMGAESK